MTDGEKCPRCHYNSGYPLSFRQAVVKGQKMRFSCRRCGHTWVKRNSFSVGGWFVYGIGGFIGIIIGIVQAAKLGFFKMLFTGIIELITGFFTTIFKKTVSIINSPGLLAFLPVCIIFISSFVFIYITIKAFQKWGLLKGLVYLFTSLIFLIPFPVWCILLIKDYRSNF
jgi:hypothetical protein